MMENSEGPTKASARSTVFHGLREANIKDGVFAVVPHKAKDGATGGMFNCLW